MNNGVDMVSRTVSFKKESLKQISYFCGDEEIASELYDRRGVLIHHAGEIPNGAATERYQDGSVKRVINFENGRPHGDSTDYYPNGEIREKIHLKKVFCMAPAKPTDAAVCYGLTHTTVPASFTVSLRATMITGMWRQRRNIKKVN